VKEDAMAKQVLQILDTAYRCTIEEQDEPAIWITHAMREAGGEFGLLLRGGAVNYAVSGQSASGLTLGGRTQTHPPRIDADVRKLMEKGITVYVVGDDLADRGIEPSELIPGVRAVPRSGVARLFDDYDEVWHW
jgi:intracellular sulfur oxidation DsrE/DsrF family protein